MSSDIPPPRYLTLTELILSYVLIGSLGYLVGGMVGVWCGAGLVTIRYAQLIWLSLNAVPTNRGDDQTPDSASNPDLKVRPKR